MVSPRADIRIGDQQAVIVYSREIVESKGLFGSVSSEFGPNGTLTVFLQKFSDGTPTTGAEIELTADFIPGMLEEVAPGVYSSDDWSLSAGRNEIELSYVIGEQSGSVAVPLSIPASTPATSQAATSVPAGAVPGYVLAIIAAILYGLVSVLFLRRRKGVLRSPGHAPKDGPGLVSFPRAVSE